MSELDPAAVKQRIKGAWSLGDYSQFVETVTAGAAQPLVDACAISAGQEVLDAAAGTGNVALAAAREGARVVAADLTPALIEAGKRRAAAEDLDIEWVEADIEELPFPDQSFECVASAFGAMFAPRPELASSELFRVLRPGGTVGMANWVPEGFQAQQFALVSRYVPPPAALPSPIDWGRTEIVESRFEGLAGSIEMRRETLAWHGESAEQYVQLLTTTAGPHIAAMRTLGADEVEELNTQLLELVREYSTGAGPITIENEFLIVVARKRG